MIKIENLKKTYGDKTVLDISDGQIGPNRITAVIGPSGAGKSTLLMIVNGLLRPSEGKVIFDESVYSETKNYSAEVVRRMAMVFQKPAMFNTSVYENIAYGLKIRKMSKAEVKENVEHIAEWTGLKEKLRQKATTLSGGEAGRVALARAMVTRPELLLMDEPTANLDPANVAVIEEMVLKANRDFGTAIAIVTHNMFQAKRLSHHTICLMNGKIMEEGPTAQVFEKPHNKQTDEFISGKMVY